jgi:predicted ATPase
MMTNITIKNFKIHQQTSLELKPLTLLTGINGVGKSSILQALLLLRQSYENNFLDKGLQLNRPHCYIGNIGDAIYQYAEDDIISFSIETESKAICRWDFSLEKNNLMGDFIPSAGDGDQSISKSLNVFNDNFHYLSASRMISSASNTFAVESRKQLSLEKGQAELVAQYLYYWGKDRKQKVFSDYLHNSLMPESDLLSQTTAWEREISPNVNVIPIKIGNSYAIKYSFNTKNDATNEFFSDNVGFGLTYALPIIVAILSSQKDSLLLIENPEAHLHPRGQSKLAELIALAAQAGIQIIIETHSDHILNGILVACKKFENNEKGIDKDLVKIYHFTRDEEKHCAIAHSVNILKDGKIDEQPEDFFDQTEKDLHYLLGF